jgi:G6PDH family F420-dependent oxidoreductase
MVELGYVLSSEEHRPNDLVTSARHAEESGFTFALISDHYHPWIDQQGQSPFVWSVIGGIAQATRTLRLGTGVTCPILRMHPAIIAQAAATSAAMMPGRFFLGVGTGENLNEHILGDKWPEVAIRREMLAEAVEVIRMLWQPGTHSFYGTYYTVENARVYTLPDQTPDIYVAASGSKAAELAGEVGDGLIGLAPERDLLKTFDDAGGAGKPKYGQLAVCWAASEEEARRTAHTWWPNTALKGEITAELPLPRHFEQAVADVTEDQVAAQIVCGPNPDRHVEMITKYIDAGYDCIYLHQVGPDQEGFFRFYQREVMPRLPLRGRSPARERRAA